MTRALSELLGAEEPAFHHGITRLEAVSGHTSTDIRLTAELERAAKLKVKELGLDPTDTTGKELYAALMARIRRDNDQLVRVLRKTYGATDDVSMHAIGAALRDSGVPLDCFALKQSTGRRLLKKYIPKQTMKLLGYRSFDSLIRREQLYAVYAAAWLLESAGWRKSILDSYRRLSAADFELRQIAIITPDTKRWRELAESIVAVKKHNIVSLKEFSALVILPLPHEYPPAAAVTTLAVSLNELNEIRAASTFLKLCQVRADFGAFVRESVVTDPVLRSSVLQGPIPWQIIQRYYSRYADRYRSDLFEPHIQRDDLIWHSVERALQRIAPNISFWEHTTALGMLDGHTPVSLNIADAALNLCNQLPFEKRIVHYFRHSLWHELMIRYLKHDAVEQSVLEGLQTTLVEQHQLL